MKRTAENMTSEIIEEQNGKRFYITCSVVFNSDVYTLKYCVDTCDIEYNKNADELFNDDPIKARLRSAIKRHMFHNNIKCNLMVWEHDDNGNLIYTDKLNRFFIDTLDGVYTCNNAYNEPETSVDWDKFNMLFNNPFKLRIVSVRFDRKYNATFDFITRINGTYEEINKYYKTNVFNVGRYPNEVMLKPVSIELIG